VADLEIRTAQLSGVRFADRIIELIVAPYESEALVPYAGRMIREVFARGAFGNIDPARRRVTANRDHDFQRSIGKAVGIRDEDDGLVAEIKISPTPLGDETLQLADDGILDASAGFRISADGEQWLERRSLRRLTKVWLHHVALTPDPAYEGARVLAVRTPTTPVALTDTPNLDAVRNWQLQADFARLRGE
jgi:HK97 family phage prohead protease